MSERSVYIYHFNTPAMSWTDKTNQPKTKSKLKKKKNNLSRLFSSVILYKVSNLKSNFITHFTFYLRKFELLYSNPDKSTQHMLAYT